MRAPLAALALALASAAALRPPPSTLDVTLDPASIKRAFDVKTGTPNKTFDPAAAAQNFKAAATNFINATKTGGGAKEAELGTLPARTGIGMLRNPSLAALRVPREGEPVAALGEDLAAPPLAMCGAGIGVCSKGLCCSQSGACLLDPYACDGTCQRQYSGMDAPCQGAYPDPVPKDDMVEAPPGGVCGVYAGARCPAGSCCSQFGFCAPEQLAPAPPSANRTGGPYGDDGGLNFWCGIASCIKDASPGSPACQAAHKLIKPTVRKFKLTYEWGKFDPDGAGLKDVILVNGQYPGPTLEVNLGDQVVIEFNNNLDDFSVLHVHGMLQIGTPAFDGVQWTTQSPAPGALQNPKVVLPDSDPTAPPKYIYSFVASVPGTFWYHSHYDEQYSDGAKGAFIVKAPPSLAQVQDKLQAAKQQAPPPPPPGAPPRFEAPLEYKVDVPVLLSDNYHTAPYSVLQEWYASTATNPDGVEPVPDSVLINGIGQGYCGIDPVNGTVAPGARPDCNWALIKAEAAPCSKPLTRLRFINAASFAPIDVFIDRVDKFVVEIDAVAIDPLFVAGPVRLNVGQRVSVAICSDDPVPETVLLRASMDQAAFFQPSPSPVSAAVVHFGKGPWDGTLPKSAPWLPLPPALQRQNAFQQANALFGPIAFNRGMRPPPATTSMTVVIEAGTLNNGDSNAFFMNAISFQPPDTPSLYSRLLGNPNSVGVSNAAPGDAGFNVQSFPLGSVVDVVINNHDGGQHPIHLHGSWFTVMAQGLEGDGDYAGQPLKPIVLRDTHTIPANSYMVLRVPVFNVMPQMLHCHIEPHLGVGLGMVLNSGYERVTPRPGVETGASVPGGKAALAASVVANGL